MNTHDVLRAWGKILQGRKPLLSIEITKECPLNCEGCYAYDPAHLGGEKVLADLSDYKSEELIKNVLALIRKLKPLHLSIVGGDPLVRYRELAVLLPQLDAMGINVQLVTSAFRELPECAPLLPKLDVVVSIDGLQPEHDARRPQATYEKILRNIRGQKITIHCTVTGPMMRQRDGYLNDFMDFWSPKREVKKIWVSGLTPQHGETSSAFPTSAERDQIVKDLLYLRKIYTKLDMREEVIRELLHPPQSPQECMFAQNTHTISADLKTAITPCQFGGNPDCSRCMCVASMGLAAVGHKKLGPVPLVHILRASSAVGKVVQFMRAES